MNTLLKAVVLPVAVFIAVSGYTQSSYKSKFSCLAGNCKNGTGIQKEEVYYTSTKEKVAEYVYLASFKDRQKQGKGIFIASFTGFGSCLEELKKYVGETRAEVIPNCSGIATVKEVFFENDKYNVIKARAALDKIRSKTPFSDYEPGYKDPLETAKFFVTDHSLVPTSILLYFSDQLDSVHIDFDNGLSYRERRFDDIVKYEVLQNDNRLFFSYTTKHWKLFKPEGENRLVRRISLVDHDFTSGLQQCISFAFPEDQNDYKEMAMDDGSVYKGGTKNGMPHGYGVLTHFRTLPGSVVTGYIKHVYSGYFVDGVKSCIGLEIKITGDYNKETGKIESATEHYVRYGIYENDRIVYGVTVFRNNYGIDRNYDIYNRLYMGEYKDPEETIYPYQGSHYTFRLHPATKVWGWLKQEEGIFDNTGNLVSGTKYTDDYYAGFAEKTMIKARYLQYGEVTVVNGEQKMVLRKDEMYVYFTDGTYVSGNTEVEELTYQDQLTARENFLCVCQACRGSGLISTTSTYYETSTYNQQVHEHVDYLGYKTVKTYRVTERTPRTATSTVTCTTCYGKGKIVCR